MHVVQQLNFHTVKTVRRKIEKSQNDRVLNLSYFLWDTRYYYNLLCEEIRNSQWRGTIRKCQKWCCSCVGLCVETDIDYLGNGMKDILNVATWYHCSEECRRTSGCSAWSWIAKSFGDSSIHHKCYLKNENYFTGRQVMTGVVSGVRNCGGMLISHITFS